MCGCFGYLQHDCTEKKNKAVSALNPNGSSTQLLKRISKPKSSNYTHNQMQTKYVTNNQLINTPSNVPNNEKNIFHGEWFIV